jgi:hypothetical protein
VELSGGGVSAVSSSSSSRNNSSVSAKNNHHNTISHIFERGGGEWIAHPCADCEKCY